MSDGKPETTRRFRAFARLSDDGRPIADSVRKEQGDGMVPVVIELPPEPTYQWVVTVVDEHREEGHDGCI